MPERFSMPTPAPWSRGRLALLGLAMAVVFGGAMTVLLAYMSGGPTPGAFIGGGLGGLFFGAAMAAWIGGQQRAWAGTPEDRRAGWIAAGRSMRREPREPVDPERLRGALERHRARIVRERRSLPFAFAAFVALGVVNLVLNPELSALSLASVMVFGAAAIASPLASTRSIRRLDGALRDLDGD
jgi:hypothetical protein